MITPKMIKPLDHKKDRRRIEQYLVVGCLNRKAKCVAHVVVVVLVFGVEMVALSILLLSL
jgi:hypothetical protein